MEKNETQRRTKGAISRAICKTLRAWFYLGLLLMVLGNTVCSEISEEVPGVYKLATGWTKQVSKFCEFLFKRLTTLSEWLTLKGSQVIGNIKLFVETLGPEGVKLLTIIVLFSAVCTIVLCLAEKNPKKAQENIQRALENFGLFLLGIQELGMQAFRKIKKALTAKKSTCLEEKKTGSCSEDDSTPPTEW